MILILLFSQHAIYGIDSGIPRGEVGEKQVDETIYGLARRTWPISWRSATVTIRRLWSW